uniref:Uncharacterized protein n=1 Tax=uncultured bacterium A1Q1_fos_500 TaxID=1256579 RepID=L7VWS0_9BACT|nr:hypothetical protein [uncultured bacterium A1Q1_fos_500]
MVVVPSSLLAAPKAASVWVCDVQGLWVSLVSVCPSCRIQAE